MDEPTSNTDPESWGWWEWAAIRAAAVDNTLAHYHLKYLDKIGLIEGPITYDIVTEKGSLGTVTKSVPRYTLKPEVADLWQQRLTEFNNCGIKCRNFMKEFLSDGRCRDCGATFAEDGTPMKKCRDCGITDVPLFGSVMDVPKYCSSCNDKKRAASGTCGICKSSRWNCCC